MANEDGLPIYADVHDGNTSDKKWNPAILQKVQKQFERLDMSHFIYVADSAAITRETLKESQAANAYIISRGPNQLKMIKEALKTADLHPDRWSEPFTTAKNGATYHVQEQGARYDGHDVRLIVVESSTLDQKKKHTLEKKRTQEFAELERERKQLEKQTFHCEEDAKEALTKWQNNHKKWSFHYVKPKLEERRTVKRKRGRPKKDERPQEMVTFHLTLSITLDEKAFEEARRKASRFVLVTTVPQPISNQEVLRRYKGQTNVEMNVSFLKDPYFVDEIYLKKPKRVKVLAYLFLISLLVYKVFQRRIRQQVTKQNPLIGAAKRKRTKPTGQAVFQMFKYIQVIVWKLPNGEQQRQFGRPLTTEQQKVLKYLGLDESIYL